LCVSGEKFLQTIWDEITSDFEDIQFLNLTQETIWNAVRAREMARPLTSVEYKRIKEGIPRETVFQESFWWMRPDGIAVRPPTGNKVGTFCILEHKRMSESWKVDQVSFITGARSVDKQDFLMVACR
jgi:hypothetical protein